MNNFLQRWKGELKVIREEKIESYRRNGFTEDVRCGWFQTRVYILKTNNFITRPHAIYNCDESGFSDETACEYKSFFNTLFFLFKFKSKKLI